MEEEKKEPQENISLAPEHVKDLVNTKASLPTPSPKTRVLPYILLGLGISILLVGIGFLIRYFILSGQKTDVYVDAPSDINITVSPIPTGETTTLIPQEILFESNPYRNDIAGFEIKIPSGWTVDDSGTSGAIVVLIDPKVTMASSSALLTFVNVTTGNPKATLADQVTSAKAGLQKQFTSYTFDEDKDMVVSGNTYHLLGGTYVTHDTKMRNRNLILIYNGRGYAISATAPDSIWPKKELLLNATLFSFRNI